MDARALLKALMDKTGDTQNSLAQKTKVPQPTIHRFLSGTAKEPRLSTFEPIAKYFGIPVEAFVSDKARADVVAMLHHQKMAKTPATIGKTMKMLRMVRGLSVGDLARAAGVDAEVISAMETGDAGGDDNLLAVANAFGIHITDLVHEAITTLDGAKQLLDRADRRAYAPSAPLVVREDHVEYGAQPEYVGRFQATKTLPVVGIAQLGENGYYEQLEYPVGHGDGYLLHASRDPEAYVLQVRGDSMKPAIRNGWYVVVEPNGTPEPGEYVVVQLVDGRKMVKELLFQHARTGDVEVMSVNGEARISIPGSSVVSIQPVAAVMPPSKVINS
ncbi:helix-turn-helix domain-containing protein [Bordetella bronchialis]|uniref:HTH cro/C1-type domain-containing protein n=1 Tax=Bordetella bronchialis TaxID=463025 RepID=A0ABN4R668_9BORD|nr:helix-turn-helix domain-containing protein [Bordetella bronchialis]ANN66454.1 hypothetical protein BAU06_09240 [Bordetella bronchialis]